MTTKSFMTMTYEEKMRHAYAMVMEADTRVPPEFTPATDPVLVRGWAWAICREAAVFHGYPDDEPYKLTESDREFMECVWLIVERRSSPIGVAGDNWALDVAYERRQDAWTPEDQAAEDAKEDAK